MPSDLRATFRQLAPEPRRSLDFGALITEGARRRRRRVTMLISALLILVGGGGLFTRYVFDDSGSQLTGTASADIDVLDELKQRFEGGGASAVQPFTSLAGLLENVLYKVSGQPAEPLTEAVVVGEVLDVEAGRGFRVDGDDAPGGIETDFDDPRALWRTVHVFVAVDSVVSGAVGESPVVVGFVFDPDVPLEQVSSDFRSFGRILLFLNRSPVFAYDSGVFGTVSDGRFLGLVDEAGNIRLPLLSHDEEADLLADASTIEALREAAKQPRDVVHLDTSGQIVDP